MVGFDAKNKDILDAKYTCSKCSFIIRDPIQLKECGHRLCQSCVESEMGATIKCSSCSKTRQRTETMIGRGFQIDMQKLPIECSVCNWTGVFQQYQSHINHFHRNPICSYCNEQFDSVNILNEHKVYQCEQNTDVCVLKNFGCKEPILRYNKKDHYISDRHQEVLQKYLQQRLLQIDNYIKSTVAENNTDLLQSSSVVAVDPDTSLFQELYDAIQALPNHEKIFDDDGQLSLNDTLLEYHKKYPMQNLDCFQTKLSMEETNRPSNESINDMGLFSNDGTCIWKITSFKEKMTDAQSDRRTSIYSPPFYSSPTGYKMRACLYLDGDGNARRTHMSLFFVLMRGSNDPFLKFPFNYKVAFCLYDQSGAQRHIIDSFRPNIESNSFQRPRWNMNIASGIPKFLPLAIIQREDNPYVQEDTIFLKILIDLHGIPNTLLPYAFSLNPGLPTQVQQALIRQEAARRAQ